MYKNIIENNNFFTEGYDYCKLIISFFIEIVEGNLYNAIESINTRKCDHKINMTIAHDTERDFPTNQCYTRIINTDDNLNALQEFCIIKQWIFLYLNLTTISKQPKSLKELAHHSALSNAIPNPFSHIDGIICTDISQNFIKKVIFMKKVNKQRKKIQNF